MAGVTSRNLAAKTPSDRLNAAVKLRPGQSAVALETQPLGDPPKQPRKLTDDDLSRLQLLSRLGSARRSRNANARKIVKLETLIKELKPYKEKCRELESALVSARDKLAKALAWINERKDADFEGYGNSVNESR